MEHLRTIHVYLTGDVITPDPPCEAGEADPVDCECTFVYGEACEHGHGATIAHGWIDNRWSRFVPWDSRDDVDPAATVDVLESVADGRDPIDAIATEVLETIGAIDECDGRGTYYAADEDRDYRSGESVRLAAHLKDARGEDLPDDLVAAVDAHINLIDPGRSHLIGRPRS